MEIATMDTSTAHELVDQMRGLTVEVAGLRASFGIYGPMIEAQVNGLADVANRNTRTEGRVDAIIKEVADHCQEQKEAEREERDGRRWLIAQIIVACGAVTAIVQSLMGMIGHK